MLTYIARRLIFGLLTIIGVSIVVFVIMRVLPGDPLVAIFGPEGFTKLTDEQRAKYMSDLGLSDPIWKQYLAWVGDILRGELGRSFFRAESVADMVARRAPLTAQIALLSVLFSWLVGIPVALVSALKPNSVWDNMVRFFSILFLAIPGFWFGILIVLGLLFGFGYRAPLTNAPFFSEPLVNLQIVIGPAIVLGLGQAAYIARMARSSLLEVVREDYVRTARAKGLSERRVTLKHALRAAIVPVVTIFGLEFAYLLAGTIFTERIFDIQGIGLTGLQAIGTRDLPIISATVLIGAAFIVVANLFVDIIYSVIDPRVRLS
jgi:peptide/nickel transport system permease protein